MNPIIRKLVTEDGEIYTGTGFGAELRDGVSAPFELVFNTSSVGYQEILTDPSYTDQGVVFAYSLVGNYGINRYDGESGRLSPTAAIVREATAEPSNFRCERTLSGVLVRSGVPGISGIDTRRLEKGRGKSNKTFLQGTYWL